MTVQEKSTAIGGGADLAEDFYDSAVIFGSQYTDTSNTTYECEKWGGIIPPETGKHNGSSSWLYYCSTDDDPSIDENSSDAEIKTSVKAHINSLTWNERAVEKGTVEGTKV